MPPFDSIPAAPQQSVALRWMLPLLLLVAGIVFAYQYWGRPSAQPVAANGDAALAALKSGASAEDLVRALNLVVINFNPGSAILPAESHDVLKKAADAIKAAPKETVIEVGGHTDNTGAAAANVKLSQARADAVRAELIKLGVAEKMLTAKGYGGAKPVADNDTEAGRLKNPRIEYTLVKK